jgi:hypothetical protein
VVLNEFAPTGCYKIPNRQHQLKERNLFKQERDIQQCNKYGANGEPQHTGTGMNRRQPQVPSDVPLKLSPAIKQSNAPRMHMPSAIHFEEASQ